MFILGIDTSCDDTSVAVIDGDRSILSNVISSQVDLHRLFGGVVPEIASRKHVELIDGIYHDALEEAGLGPSDMDAIAVTSGPGLIGSVLVGLCFAKGLSLFLKKPLIAVNHVMAHAMSIFLEKEVEFPFVGLVVSGGHTMILLHEDPLTYKVLGSTRDDAAGEAFDKIAKYLGIGYPGGRIIEEYATRGMVDYVQFPRPMADEPDYDFSFSGLKTAMINYVKKNGVTPETISDVLASFQEAICDVLAMKTLRAARDHGIPRIVVGGGVASNGRLREIFLERCRKESLEVRFSSPRFCTDNGAMVAVLGLFYHQREIESPIDVKAYSRMALHAKGQVL
jgi:N6-L-threonylcarbamoyladenine synthase